MKYSKEEIKGIKKEIKNLQSELVSLDLREKVLNNIISQEVLFLKIPGPEFEFLLYPVSCEFLYNYSHKDFVKKITSFREGFKLTRKQLACCLYPYVDMEKYVKAIKVGKYVHLGKYLHYPFIEFFREVTLLRGRKQGRKNEFLEELIGSEF